jgi:parvulin-like peptidyl-prolyl isomerase
MGVALTGWLPRTLTTRLCALMLLGTAIGITSSALWITDPEVAATVNGEAITAGEWQRLVADPSIRNQLQHELGMNRPDEKELKRLALRKLIDHRLILQDAARRKLTVSEQEIETAMAALRRRFKDSRAFETWLRTRALDEKSLRDALRTNLLTSRVTSVVVENVQITEEEIEQYYEKYKGRLRVPEQVRFGVIAVNDKSSADAVLALLKKGENFGWLARERSQGFGAKDGGDSGWVSLVELSPALREAVNSLREGETSRPIAVKSTFLIIRLEKRRPARFISLQQARPQIEERLLAAKRREVLQAWLAAKEYEAKIEVSSDSGN